MAKSRKPARKADPYATAIGNVAINIAYLESTIDGILMEWAGIVDFDVSNIFVGHTNLNQKIMMMNGLGFLRKPSYEWFERLRTELNRVDSLQERRNRVIHDLWSPLDKKNYQRIRFRVLLRKPQSRQPLQMTTIERTPVKVEEIWKLADEISEMTSILMILDHEMRAHPKPPSG